MKMSQWRLVTAAAVWGPYSVLPCLGDVARQVDASTSGWCCSMSAQNLPASMLTNLRNVL